MVFILGTPYLYLGVLRLCTVRYAVSVLVINLILLRLALGSVTQRPEPEHLGTHGQ